MTDESSSATMKLYVETRPQSTPDARTRFAAVCKAMAVVASQYTSNAVAADDKAKSATAEKNDDCVIKKKKWSHRDPSSGHGSIEMKTDLMPIQFENKTRRQRAEMAVGIDEEMTMTKAALKRKRKKDAGVVNLPFKAKKGGKYECDSTTSAKVTPVDYSQYSSKMFNVPVTTRSNIFDPFRSADRGKSTAPRRYGVGTRMQSKSTSFKPKNR